MKKKNQSQRREEIMDIAVDVLSEKGYQNTSMLEIAKRASASKETLYAWFRNKQGLFESIIQRNAESVHSIFNFSLDVADKPIDLVVDRFGFALLELVLGDESIAINRAAISEFNSDSTLAKILIVNGREFTIPLFIQYLDEQIIKGTIKKTDTKQATETYLGLLFTDKQIRRLLGAVTKPTTSENKTQSTLARTQFLKLYT